ncbi:general transcription factor II-I repeat domain-containing protein 2-like [Entelurus aequoreus]|uniref:general transcription factor II-I repeat domain-containing protein 2-like n=1 Tax=Entelurus aequoreus TaxID=161455 RepID=UPI002B1DCE87|nr:general transcription factor II-I repeat domain-containing protein 2-like [Entelurus aequoreus]
MRRVETIAGNLELQLKNRTADFDCFSLALDESCDVRDTPQLLIFLRGITADFQITEELAAMQSIKETTTERNKPALATWYKGRSAHHSKRLH